MRSTRLLVPLLFLAGCHGEAPPSPMPATPAATGKAIYSVHAWPLPSSSGSAQPDLVATPDGRILLSWISSMPGRRNALQFVALGDDEHWQSAPRTIAVGNSLMANWADIPHLMTTPDGAMWVHWLQTSGGGGYAADVVLSRSTDGGFNWSAPAPVNTDTGGAEHGFVSLWPASRDTLGVAWLDGRDKAADATTATGKGAQDAPGAAAMQHMHDEGAMALRAAVFDRNLQRSGETVVDAMTCDCCQTDLALTSSGPLLVYRDRSDGEIRDIVATRFDGQAWSAPKPVHVDGWKMPACPINGPSIAADGGNVLVGWYTAADDRPRVQLARSADAGGTWSEPVVLDEGEAVQGRVTVALDGSVLEGGQAWVLWVREDDKGQSLWLSRRSPDLAHELQRLQVAQLQGRGKATGFPQLVVRDGRAHIVWTDIAEGAPRLRGAIVSTD